MARDSHSDGGRIERQTPDTGSVTPIGHHRVEQQPDGGAYELVCVRCGGHADDLAAFEDDECDSPEARSDDSDDGQEVRADGGTADETDAVAEEYRPMYEFDADAGRAGGPGEVVCQVPEEPQRTALKEVAGEGPVEPDGWATGYETTIPVVGGVPITLLDGGRHAVATTNEGRESAVSHAVEGVGRVEVHKAFSHPGNASKIKVSGGGEGDR